MGGKRQNGGTSSSNDSVLNAPDHTMPLASIYMLAKSANEGHFKTIHRIERFICQ